MLGLDQAYHVRGSLQQSDSLGNTQMVGVVQAQTVNTNTGKSACACEESSLAMALPEDDDVSESFLRVLGIDSHQPRFTEDQEEMERAKMTNAERAAALSDLFGKYCTIDSPQSKRARKDLDSESIQFLLSQMKIELDQIPVENKQALLEARVKCELFEFSDKRLEQFLRCEGMNAKLAAQRFVNYWESRRKVFGSEKYLLRMTLSEALRDDLDAIEDGVFCLLPRLDLSGRPLLFLDPKRRSDGRYSSESLVR
jgi:hypothetical protein